MPVASGETPLKLVTLEALLLPKGSRTVTEVTITAASAIDEGDETASLSASVSTAVKAGCSLSFNVTSPSGATRRKQIVIKDDVTIATSSTSVNIFAATQAVPANETAKYIEGLEIVAGLQDFSFQSQDTTVDTTDTLSGAGTESAIVRSGLNFSISVIERIANKGLSSIIKPVALDFAFKGREIYARLMYPDGEVHAGPAKVMNFSQPGNQNEVKKCTFELQLQGSGYVYLPAYTF